MFITLRRSSRFLAAVVAVGLMNGAVQAQSLARPNAIVQVFEAGPTPASQATQPSFTSYLATANPAKGSVSKFGKVIPSDGAVYVSPDGQREAASQVDEAGKSQVIVYSDQATQTFPTALGHSVLWINFSEDGKYLSFTTAASEIDEWSLTLVELSTGRKIEFAGPYGLVQAATPSPTTFVGAANVVAWSPDAKKLYLQTYFPFSSEGGFDSLYVMDVSAFSFDKPGRFPVPPSARLIKNDTQVINYAFAPDMTRLAYTYFNAASPAQPDETGQEKIANTVVLMDLASGQGKQIYQSEPGQGLGFSFTWSDDSASLIFMGGNYTNNSFGVAPEVFTYTVASGAVAKSPALTTDPAESLQELMACGQSLFFTISKDNGNGDGTVSLYSLPLGGLKAHDKPLVAGLDILLLTCGPIS